MADFEVEHVSTEEVHYYAGDIHLASFVQSNETHDQLDALPPEVVAEANGNIEQKITTSQTRKRSALAVLAIDAFVTVGGATMVAYGTVANRLGYKLAGVGGVAIGVLAGVGIASDFRSASRDLAKYHAVQASLPALRPEPNASTLG